MNSSRFWQKRTGKSSFKEVSGFDLFYQLTYMSALAAAGISRSRIFQLASKLPSPSSRYFEKIDILSQKLAYNYPEACSMVGEAAKSKEIKSFLLRLSDALTSGEPMADFLAREAQVQGEYYSNEYERDLESLRKWTDAYAALIVSVALIVIINLISTMIYEMETALMAGLAVLAATMGFFGAWVLSRSAPKEVRSVSSSEGSREQRLSRKLLKVLASVTLVACLSLALLGVELRWLLVLASFLLLPIGRVGLLIDRRTSKKDEEISSFLRSLGGMATSTGTTLTEALTRIDLSSFPALEPDVKRLHQRLVAFIDPKLCWQKFEAETGSKLISQGASIFHDAVDMGADPERVGFLCSLFATKTVMLRAKRRVVSSTFVWLSMVMHVAVVALMVFIVEIIGKFQSLIEGLALERGEQAVQMMALPIPLLAFGSAQIRFLYQMTIFMILLLTLTNTLALIATDGGHISKAFCYLCISLFIVGASLLYVPPLVNMIM